MSRLKDYHDAITRGEAVKNTRFTSVSQHRYNTGDSSMVSSKFFETKVAGVTFPNPDGSSRQQSLSKCKKGMRIILEPEPTNKYDPNAIKVIAEGVGQIGYIPKGFLYIELIPKIESGSCRAMIEEVDDYEGQYYCKIRIDLL